MKFVIAFLLASFVCLHLSAQYVSVLKEYKPAPGQVINTEGAGSPAAAASVCNSNNGLVSLGAFGGYVVFAFDKPVENDPDNPYGVDFIIFGNAQPDWSEPGTVMVMKDENKNGEADDEWFELAGSDYFFSNTIKNFNVTYINSGGTSAEDVQWYSDNSETGFVYANSFHLQPYYPGNQLFSDFPADNVSFEGTRIRDYVDVSNPGMVKNYERKFGYADNHIRLNDNYKFPDNPYTDEQEGCGGDPMDISWAVNKEGQYVEIDRIDFVKVSTAVLANAGWLGELSTEITAIADVPSNASIKGKTDCVVIKDLPLKMIVNDSCSVEGFCFINGRYSKNTALKWETDNNAIAEITNDGKLIANNSGKVTVTASFSNDENVFTSRLVEVVKPVKVKIDIESDFMRQGDKVVVSGKIYDENSKEINNISTQWIVSDSDIISIIEKNGSIYLEAISEGESNLVLKVNGNDKLFDEVKITVLSSSETKEFYITVKDESSVIIPRRKIKAGSFNLTPYVDRSNDDYGIKSVSSVTLAHAVAQTLIDEGHSSNFRFRDDEMGDNALYLWKVPEGDDDNMEFVYGYGGTIEPEAFAKSWIIALNNKHVVTGLNNYPIKNDDEIIVYHQPDLTETWSVTNFYSDKTEVGLMEDFTVYSAELTCRINESGNVEVTGTYPLANYPISINDETAYFNGNKVITDDNGKAILNFREAGIKNISNGIDQMIVNVSGATSNKEISDVSDLIVWPLPADDYLNITSEKLIKAISIFDISGRKVLFQSNLSSGNVNLDISALKSGSYIIEAGSEDWVVRKKVIIR